MNLLSRRSVPYSRRNRRRSMSAPKKIVLLRTIWTQFRPSRRKWVILRDKTPRGQTSSAITALHVPPSISTIRASQPEKSTAIRRGTKNYSFGRDFFDPDRTMSATTSYTMRLSTPMVQSVAADYMSTIKSGCATLAASQPELALVAHKGNSMLGTIPNFWDGAAPTDDPQDPKKCHLCGRMWPSVRSCAQHGKSCA